MTFIYLWKKIISGGNIDDSNFTFANILINLASYSVYKFRINYYHSKEKNKSRLKKLLQC